jgi:SAM-dependent methyltransferase
LLPLARREARVGLYSRFIFPRLCDFALGRLEVARHRRALLNEAAGEILEIGFGTGLNLPHYPDHVRRITAVDPSAGMARLAQRRMQAARIQVVHRQIGGESLPAEDASFDCVVCTFTLCSIDAVERAVAEVYRVLRPGGRFLFLEHGVSPDPRVRAWQRRLNWLEQRLADGCRLTRDPRALVAALPFAALNVTNCYLEGAPRTHGYLYRGIATR